MGKKLIWLSLFAFSQTSLGAATPREEGYLLNHQIPREKLESNLRVWDERDPQSPSWRPMQPAEQPSPRAKVLVVNLWADYCQPCRDEFPLLREMATNLEDRFKSEVQFIYVSETASSDSMKAFLQTNRGRMPPRERIYQDTGEALAEELRQSMPAGAFPLPATLILDEERVVRYSIIGAMIQRRSELVSAVENLVRLSQQRGAANSHRIP